MLINTKQFNFSKTSSKTSGQGRIEQIKDTSKEEQVNCR